ncbi:glyoxalase domain-containing protein 4-like [Convolutriloba macropyga]|uniref:glyoxalase domain-containing protein 4-like n=1 Tax=Convolutriloba macropyga TaxID=536237 RepID=UPI003F527E7F
MDRVLKADYPKTEFTNLSGDGLRLLSPDGYKFYVTNASTFLKNKDAGAVKTCSLAVSSLENSLKYWKDFLQMTPVPGSDNREALLTYSQESQCYLRLVQMEEGESVEHATAYGRIAFSVPEDQVEPMEVKSKENNYTVLTPFVSLDTPGKATVRVVILADPDGHEICFVGDEGFRDLSQVQSDADKCINEAMDKDKSDEWIKRMAAMDAK